jgi:hypothetical protein
LVCVAPVAFELNIGSTNPAPGSGVVHGSELLVSGGILPGSILSPNVINVVIIDVVNGVVVGGGVIKLYAISKRTQNLLINYTQLKRAFFL